jgi:hypothetical protein
VLSLVLLVFAAAPPDTLAPYFRPPAAFARDLGHYRSPLLFDAARSSSTTGIASWARGRS